MVRSLMRPGSIADPYAIVDEITAHVLATLDERQDARDEMEARISDEAMADTRDTYGSS